MTVRELSSVYYIKKETARIERKIEQLRNAAEKVTPTLSTQPKGNGMRDKVGEYATAIAALRTQLEEIHTQRLHEESRLYGYINSIPDALTRLIFQYRFIDCLTWNEVAREIGGNHNEKSVSQICYRYIKDK